MFVTLHTIAFSRKHENLYLDILEASVRIKNGRYTWMVYVKQTIMHVLPMMISDVQTLLGGG